MAFTFVAGGFSPPVCDFMYSHTTLVFPYDRISYFHYSCVSMFLVETHFLAGTTCKYDITLRAGLLPSQQACDKVCFCFDTAAHQLLSGDIASTAFMFGGHSQELTSSASLVVYWPTMPWSYSACITEQYGYISIKLVFPCYRRHTPWKHKCSATFTPFLIQAFNSDSEVFDASHSDI